MTDEFKIDSGFPIPPPRGNGNAKYPFSQLGPGDSFFVASKTPNDLGGCIRCARARLPGRTFRASVVTESGVRGVRVWRVS